MYIFEITQPGTWLDYPDRDWAWQTEGLLRHLESEFFDANLALNLFIQSLTNREAPVSEQWEKDVLRRTEIGQQIMQRHGGGFAVHDLEALHFETEVLFKREQWSQGRLPQEFQRKQAIIFAQAFLYALDGFEKFLRVLSEQTGVPTDVSKLHAELRQEFPNLRQVRNTAQHMEDRARGLGAGRNPQPLNLQPVDNQLMRAPGGALVLNCLNGTKYGCTMADGHYGEVDVAPVSMETLQRIFQSVLESFQWHGSKRHSPNI